MFWMYSRNRFLDHRQKSRIRELRRRDGARLLLLISDIANDGRRHARHDFISRGIARNHRSGAYQSLFAYRDPTENGRVATYGSTGFYVRSNHVPVERRCKRQSLTIHCVRIQYTPPNGGLQYTPQNGGCIPGEQSVSSIAGVSRASRHATSMRLRRAYK